MHIFNLTGHPRSPLSSYSGSQTYSLLPAHMSFSLLVLFPLMPSLSSWPHETSVPLKFCCSIQREGHLLWVLVALVCMDPQAHLCLMPLCLAGWTQWTAWYHSLYFSYSSLPYWTHGAQEIPGASFFIREQRQTIRKMKFLQGCVRVINEIQASWSHGEAGKDGWDPFSAVLMI